MSNDDPSHLLVVTAAVAMSREDLHRRLLQSVVDVARAMLSAEAATIFVFDPLTNELTFEAVSGSGMGLLGHRISADTGIAGWVLSTRQPLVIEDVQQDPRFAGEIAAQIGYTPTSLIAVPLVSDAGSLGVLEVLDRPERPEATLQQANLLAIFADQASIALELLGYARRARTILAGEDEAGVVAGIVESLQGASDAKRERGLRLLEELHALLKL